MRFIYSAVRSLEGTEKIGTKHCAALIQHFTPGVGVASSWSEGDTVMGNKDIVAGTAIATFVNGMYPNKNKGNRAAYFLHQTVNGYFVMDQWTNDKLKAFVSKRLIRAKGKQNRDGTWPDAVDNAFAYSIIER